jgi:hypothetical protein
MGQDGDDTQGATVVTTDNEGRRALRPAAPLAFERRRVCYRSDAVRAWISLRLLYSEGISSKPAGNS